MEQIENIEKFKEEYDRGIREEVLPALKPLEKERKLRSIYALSLSIIALILIPFVFVLTMDFSSIHIGVIASISVSIVVFKTMITGFKNDAKNKVHKIITKLFKDFVWTTEPSFNISELEESYVTSSISGCLEEIDDCIIGKYKNIKFEVVECAYTSIMHNTTIFRGVIIKLQMNKQFKGLTTVRSVNDLQDNVKHLEKIKLEDVDFNSQYNVYANDQIEARYLLTPSFMERLKNIKNAFNADWTNCSFYKNDIYLALATQTDKFEFCNLADKIDTLNNFEIFFNEIISILALIDHFKLDKKLGL